jgi:serine/threonine protein kinase
MDKLHGETLSVYTNRQWLAVTDPNTFVTVLNSILITYNIVIGRLYHMVYQLGISHGDLHDDNIILDTSGPKFIDFGSAWRIRESDKPRKFAEQLKMLMFAYDRMYTAYITSPSALDERTRLAWKKKSIISDDFLKYTLIGFHQLMTLTDINRPNNIQTCVDIVVKEMIKDSGMK